MQHINSRWGMKNICKRLSFIFIEYLALILVAIDIPENWMRSYVSSNSCSMLDWWGKWQKCLLTSLQGLGSQQPKLCPDIKALTQRHVSNFQIQCVQMSSSPFCISNHQSPTPRLARYIDKIVSFTFENIFLICSVSANDISCLYVKFLYLI